MEYLNVFYRIFREDMRLLQSEFLPVQTYKGFLKKYHPYISTHYSVHCTKNAENNFLATNKTETAFYEYENITPKQGFTPVMSKNLDPELLQFLVKTYGIKENEINELHLKESKTTYQLDIFIHKSYMDVSDTELCYYYYYKIMSKTYSSITQYLHDLEFDTALTEEQRKDNIQKYQLKLNQYRSELEQKHLKESIGTACQQKSMQDVFKNIYNCLDNTLVFLEEYYPNYLDKSACISHQKWLQFTKEYHSKSEILILLFKTQELPRAIENELCKILYRIPWNKLNTISYSQQEYYCKYIDLFTSLLNKATVQDHEQIYSLLIALNLNTHTACKAMTKELLDPLESLSTETQRQTYLYRQLIWVEEIQITAKVSYRAEFLNIKAYLINSIRQRLKLSYKAYETEQMSNQKISKSDIGQMPLTDPNISRRKLNLNVAELSLIARLFLEIGVVSVKDGEKQNYFKFLTKIYQSKDADQVSYSSIKNNFYSISRDTFDRVERNLIRMLNKLQMLRDSKVTS